MGLHHELPIYKAAYDLLGMAIDVTRNIPRDFKRLIGEAVREECVQLLVLIFRANVSRDKVQHIEQLLERVQVIELLLRMSRDKRFISVGQYLHHCHARFLREAIDEKISKEQAEAAKAGIK